MENVPEHTEKYKEKREIEESITKKEKTEHNKLQNSKLKEPKSASPKTGGTKMDAYIWLFSISTTLVAAYIYLIKLEKKS